MLERYKRINVKRLRDALPLPTPIVDHYLNGLYHPSSLPTWEALQPPTIAISQETMSRAITELLINSRKIQIDAFRELKNRNSGI